MCLLYEGVHVLGTEFLISYTFQRKHHYIFAYPGKLQKKGETVWLCVVCSFFFLTTGIYMYIF